jgi:SPP1 family predicted phage head-tail adaptor
VTFAKRSAGAEDGFGNTESDFADQFTVSASILERVGGEQVMASRLSGTQPATIRVRYSSQTKLVTSDWKAVNARNGDIWNIRSVANPDQKKMYLDILAEKGVAV